MARHFKYRGSCFGAHAWENTTFSFRLLISTNDKRTSCERLLTDNLYPTSSSRSQQIDDCSSYQLIQLKTWRSFRHSIACQPPFLLTTLLLWRESLPLLHTTWTVHCASPAIHILPCFRVGCDATTVGINFSEEAPTMFYWTSLAMSQLCPSAWQLLQEALAAATAAASSGNGVRL